MHENDARNRPDLLEEAVRVTGAPSKSVAVRLGLKALVDEAARRRLAALFSAAPDN
jgi:Arc/MetJ family transcription regulator